MSRKWFLFSVSAFLFIQFIFFSYLVHKNLFKQIDFNTTVVFQNHISRHFDGLFSVLSYIGRFEATTIVLVVLFILTRRWKSSIVSLGLYGVFHFIELFGKYFVNHPPPMQFMIRTQQLAGFPQFDVRSEFSYPSGHAGRALFLTVIIGVMLWQSKRFSTSIKILLTALLFGYDIAMVLSRVVLGEHWLTDIIGGSLLGAALGALSGIFFEPKNKSHEHTEKSEKKSFFPRYKLVKVE